jgi:hypothetical protein
MIKHRIRIPDTLVIRDSEQFHNNTNVTLVIIQFELTYNPDTPLVNTNVLFLCARLVVVRLRIANWAYFSR